MCSFDRHGYCRVGQYHSGIALNLLAFLYFLVKCLPNPICVSLGKDVLTIFCTCAHLITFSMLVKDVSLRFVFRPYMTWVFLSAFRYSTELSENGNYKWGNSNFNVALIHTVTFPCNLHHIFVVICCIKCIQKLKTGKLKFSFNSSSSSCRYAGKTLFHHMSLRSDSSLRQWCLVWPCDTCSCQW